LTSPEIDLERPEVLPRVLSGRYRLDAKIGQGGMGVVYVGHDMTMRRPIAVKLIRGEATGDDEAINRFLREAKNTAKIQHEHIVEVFDLGRSEEGELYFVMEYLQGESLSTRLRREGRLPPRLAVHIAVQVCNALEYAHRHGIIHRDLKPGNLMIVRRGNDEAFVKVLDFGVSKSQDQHTQLTRTGMLVGTVEYMAPEQIIGRGVDARADIYSLGVLLYRTLAGTPVFKDAAVPALINAHINEKPDSLVRRAPNAGISRALDEVIQKCLAKRPEHRYRSMAELATALVTAIEMPPEAVDDPYPSGQETLVAPRTGEHAAQDGVSVAFDLNVPPPPDSMDATRHEGGGPKKCASCGTENPRLTATCRRCGTTLVVPSATLPAQSRMQGPGPDDVGDDFLETQVMKTKVMPPRASSPAIDQRPPLMGPAAGAPPPQAPMPPPNPMGMTPSGVRPLQQSVPGHQSPMSNPAHPMTSSPVNVRASYPPHSNPHSAPRSNPHSSPRSGPPPGWPADPSAYRTTGEGNRTGPTIRSRGEFVTWKRVVVYLFLLVLFANMCAERFKLGSLILFLGGAFLVSVGWLIVRAREG
jgi:serine/threonine protein kinase